MMQNTSSKMKKSNKTKDENEQDNQCRQLKKPNTKLPFFAYGIFKPGQIAYSKISDLDFEMKEAEVCHSEAGAPYFRLSGRLKERVGDSRRFLSVSHDGGMAAAYCTMLAE